MQDSKYKVLIEKVREDIDSKDIGLVCGTSGSSGLDIKCSESGIIEAGSFKAIPTGIKILMPKGLEAQIRARSGLAAKFGVTVLNSPGTIDSDYRGEVRILLINHGKQDFLYTKGDRIAQVVFSKVFCYEPSNGLMSINLIQPHGESNEIEKQTDRDAGGFGHTGR